MTNPPRGPIESLDWPQHLTAHVVDPGPPARIHGYEVGADLARNYRFGEIILLALSGEAPSSTVGRAFEAALAFAAPATVGEAPVHGAALARLCSTPVGGAIGYGGIALSEEAHSLAKRLEPLWEWLAGPPAPVPDALRPSGATEHQSREQLHHVLATIGFACPALENDLGIEASIAAVWAACGLDRAELFEVAWVMARLPCLVAEALAVTPGRFEEYPMQLPRFNYGEGDG